MGADQATVEVVRSFNRTVTQRVGALNERYLSRDRPLGAARLLWEIGRSGCQVKALRERLGLDSGYLSRLLRSLEADGLVVVVPSDTDARVRMARLTARGKSELDVLDRRSDALARSMVGSLTSAQCQRLTAAMTEVQNLLTAAAVELREIDPEHPHAQECLAAYFAELNRRFAHGFDPAASLPAAPEDMRHPAGLFLVAVLGHQPVGCGALKFHDEEPSEIKRMWVSGEVRGLGVGRRLLYELESRAIHHGSHMVRLETNRSLTEAIQLYRSSGYREVAPFNNEPFADHWFEKNLDES